MVAVKFDDLPLVFETTGCEAVGLDWTQDLGATRRRVGHQVAL